jgi:hypothetical protein
MRRMRFWGKVEIEHVVATDTAGQKGEGLFDELTGSSERKGRSPIFELIWVAVRLRQTTARFRIALRIQSGLAVLVLYALKNLPETLSLVNLSTGEASRTTDTAIFGPAKCRRKQLFLNTILHIK